MDNVCHTFVGAAFGEAGLKQRTRFGYATLMIAGNLPDLDVLVFATSTPAVAFRRGWTHGLAAQLLLPLALTGLMLLVARRWPDDDRRGRVHVGWLLACSYIGVLSHVLLDLLNNYGVRLLAPIDWRWFYGDSVFIIDPWLWLTLGLGVWLARRRLAPSPARVAVVAAALYIAAICVSAQVARIMVIEQWTARSGAAPRAVMVGPVPVTPFTREVIVDEGRSYRRGTFSWRTRTAAFENAGVPKQDDDPRVAVARQAPHIRAFLSWSRFPYWTFRETDAGTAVFVSDLRFGQRGSAFTGTVVVPRQVAPR